MRQHSAVLNDRGDDETALLCSMTEVMRRRHSAVLNDRGDDETALLRSMTEVMMRRHCCAQ